MSGEQKEQEQPFSYGDDIKVSRNAHDAKPVPLNGANIPSTMTDDADWLSRPVTDSAPIDTAVYGDEYKKVEQQRLVLTQIKKDLATLHKHVVSFQNSKSDLHRTERDAMLSSLQTQTQQFADAPWYAQYEGVVKTAQRDSIEPDEMIKFAHDDIKRLSALVFNHNQRLMQELKKIKQAYNAKQQ